jgi:hypothetical protein
VDIPTFAEKYRCAARRQDGEQVIPGKLGNVYEHDSATFGLMFIPDKARLWKYARRKLEAAGFAIWQDGDEEGSAPFDPSDSGQARLALKVVGISRRRRGRSLTPRRARELAQISQKKRQEAHLATQNGRSCTPSPPFLNTRISNRHAAYNSFNVQIGSQDLVFFLGTLGVPSVLVFLNFEVRRLRKWYYTSGSDFLFALMTISFSCAVLSKDVSPHIRNPDLRDASGAIFIILGLLIMVVWYWAVSRVEVDIDNAIRYDVPAHSMPQLKIFFAWALAVVLFASELGIFFYR